MKTKIIIGFVILFLVLALSSMTYFWYKEKNKPVLGKTEYEYLSVPVKPLIKIKEVEVPGPERVKTIEKEKIVEKVKMPDWFVQNKDEQAIASGEVPSYEGKTSVIATLNTKTGKGNIIAKQEPLSLVGFINDKEVYGKAGYSTNNETQVTIGAEWKFFRVGKIKVGVFGEGKAYFSQKDTGNRDNMEAVGGIIVSY